MEIAKIVGPDDATATRSGDDSGSRISIPMMEVVKLAPHAFRSVGSVAAEAKVTVVIPDLFDQLTKGRVAVPLSSLIATVPLDNRSAEATMHGDELIYLPLPLVVSLISPAELQKRTAKQEVDRGEKFLPNLFTPGSVKKAPSVAPIPTTTEPVSAASAPSAPPPTVSLPPSPIVTAPAPMPIAAQAAPPVSPAPITPVIPPAPVAKSPVPEVAPTLSPITTTPVVPSTPLEVSKPEPIVPSEPVQPPSPVIAAPAPIITAPSVVSVPVVAPKMQPEELLGATTATSRAEVEAQQAKEQKVAMEAALEDASARDHGLLLYGVDINQASAEEMVLRFNGVGRKLAEKIVANRVEFGLFKDVYDLARVPGVKGKVFQRISGMAWPAALFRHREQVATLLGVVGNDIPDVRGIAQRFKELEGFHGCIMIDQDGLVLSATWEHPSSDALGAFAPQMFKKLSRYVKQLKLGSIKTLTFFADDQPITLVTSGAILFVAVHKPTRFSKRQVELVQALATELGRKLQR